MARWKTQSGNIAEGDIVVLVEQVQNPGQYHVVGKSYRVTSVNGLSGRDYAMMETLDGQHSNLGALKKRLKKL